MTILNCYNKNKNNVITKTNNNVKITTDKCNTYNNKNITTETTTSHQQKTSQQKTSQQQQNNYCNNIEV